MPFLLGKKHDVLERRWALEEINGPCHLAVIGPGLITYALRASLLYSLNENNDGDTGRTEAHLQQWEVLDIKYAVSQDDNDGSS